MDAPRSSKPTPDIKESLREQLVALFLTRKNRISQKKARRFAEITGPNGQGDVVALLRKRTF
jgi:hypothetical protein